MRPRNCDHFKEDFIMVRLPILLVLAASLMGGGCGEGIGKNIAQGIKKELESTLSGLYADLYGEYSEEGDVLDDGEVSVDEVVCSDPLFTRRESLPPEGTHPQGLVTSGNSYWKCEDSNERYHADGRVSGTSTSDYQDVLDFWNICGVGTRPPDFSGIWNITTLKLEEGNLDVICARADIMPGLVICSAIALSSDGLTYTTYGELLLFHDGETAVLEVEGEDTCVLREE